jgi:hypothetical protein
VSLRDHFPELIAAARSSINQFLNGVKNPEMAIVQFLEGATLMKHADFIEEREVRIVAIPGAEGYQKQGTIENPDYVWNPLPAIRPRPDRTGRRYVNLFEGCDETLPIKPSLLARRRGRRSMSPRRAIWPSGHGLWLGFSF